jgi:hypothetical protein
MTIYQGSRYEGEPVVSVQKADRSWVPTVFRPVISTPTPRGEIHAREGDTLQHLADKYYNDAEKWWILADANPQILYPDAIPPGTVLRIP